MALFCRLLPLWALLVSIAGYGFSEEIDRLETAIAPLLTVTMFSMGLTLTYGEFVDAFKQPAPLFLGIALQFLLMPLLAWFLGHAFALSTILYTGMILLGTAPGGTASNVLVFLSGGRVALSVSMTMFSNLSAIIVMPWLSSLLLGTLVEVDRIGMLVSILKIVTIPVLAGVLINRYYAFAANWVKPFLPAIAVFSISITIGIVVALNASALKTVTAVIVLAVLAHNSLGLASGYLISRLAGLDTATARTVAIEVGTQNSGLSIALALKHFSVLSALPATIYSISQNIFGAALAAYWAKKAENS